MAPKKRDFYGKEVADAIKKACDKLGLPQEQLEIEVVETGSTGIFGLIRKKAHIRVLAKPPEGEAGASGKGREGGRKSRPQEPVESAAEAASPPASQPSSPPEEATAVPAEAEEPPAEEATAAAEPAEQEKEVPARVEPEAVERPRAAEAPQDDDDDSDLEDEDEAEEDEQEELPEEVVAVVREELQALLDLMGYPSAVEIATRGNSVTCRIAEEHQEVLTGQDGKTLDSLQYLLRKIVARKVPNRLRLTVDVGDYRQRRLEELRERAVELAARVKEDGRTQVITALSPSERRVIHMSLQDDKEIRSRSVGDGLFKKILIYKPGKSGKGGGKGGGRKRGNSRGRRGPNNRKKNS